MDLLGDNIEDILSNLICEEIINFKKSGQIDHFPIDKLTKIYSDKTRINMINQYTKAEYQGKDIWNDKNEYCKIGKFCFSGILSEFNLTLTPKQIEKLFSILTLEQLEKVNERLSKDPNGWY